MKETDRQKMLDAIMRKEWHISDQKKYTTTAINNIKKLDGYENDLSLMDAIATLTRHRTKLNER